MKSTVTSKGQVTIPQEIRSKAKIVPGSQLNFQLENDGTLIAHVLSRDISELKGMIKIKRKKPVSLKEMKNAISDGANESTQ